MYKSTWSQSTPFRRLDNLVSCRLILTISAKKCNTYTYTNTPFKKEKFYAYILHLPKGRRYLSFGDFKRKKKKSGVSIAFGRHDMGGYIFK